MKIVRHLIAIACATTLAACSPGEGKPESADANAKPEQGVLNIYSSRHYDADLQLYKAFTDETGVKVNLIEADADALIARIQSEGEFSPADILLTVDAGRLWRAEEAKILSPIESSVLAQRIPAEFSHPQKLWYGFSTRARIIIYNKAGGLPAPLADYADLANAAHRGKVCMRSSSNIYNVSLLASIISHEGVPAAEAWTKGVVANFARGPEGNDSSMIEAVAAGTCQISIVNSYYLARFIASQDPAQHKVAEGVATVFPNHAGRGTHVNISGGGVPVHAPNRANAIRFLEFMSSDAAQEILTHGNHEYPVVAGIAQDAAVNKLGTFKRDTLDVSQLGVNQTEAVQIFDRAGWN
ncbi:MAG: Fe(3+) ABC transporter substrate-binding protein [Burkholderiales bacterium]|nr:MAG: Fe(3+) ABC transporter substrate-binding protein [Burkholderiales bacterium]